MTNIKTYQSIPPVVNGLSIDEAMDNLWMEIGNPIEMNNGVIFNDIRSLKFENKLMTEEWDDIEKIPELIVDQLCRNPDYIHFTCKYILNIDLLPYQAVILKTLWEKPLPMIIASRGAGKSFCLAIYIVLRALFHQGCRIAIVGASLRQSMVVFKYVEEIWDKSPILQDICGKRKHPRRDQHMCFWECGDSKITWLPLGDGTKIRGQRANIILADEFASIGANIFETVVRGFAAVKSEGVHMNVMSAYKQNVLKHFGSSHYGDFKDATEELENTTPKTILHNNQIVIAGTAYYSFNHFYQYYEKYKAIITGDTQNLGKDIEIDKNINRSDYAIIRIPYDMVPEGLMDKGILAQGRTTMDSSIFDMEYGTVFKKDSEGFFLASSLESATCPVLLEDDEIVDFNPKLIGSMDKEYIMGIDPASENDNFAISIIERNNTHNRIVYMWSTNRKEFEELKKQKLLNTKIKDYNTYFLYHIRDLFHRFNIVLIIMDTGGGGVGVREGLKDEDKFIYPSDKAIYDMEDEELLKLDGHHVLKMIEFSNYKWRRDSHYALKNDITTKKLLFPKYDPTTIALSSFEEKNLGKVLDTVEDCNVEILQCKQETTMIQHSETSTGQEKWDVPKITGIDADQVRKKLKRDRFTSLLLSNWGCRLLEDQEFRQMHKPTRRFFGGLAKDMIDQGHIRPPVISNNSGRTIYIGV